MNTPLLEHTVIKPDDLSTITPVILDLSIILGESRYQKSPPFIMVLDEYGYYASANFGKALSSFAMIGRKHNVGTIMATQKLSDLKPTLLGCYTPTTSSDESSGE